MSIKGQGHSLTYTKGYLVWNLIFFSQKQLSYLKPDTMWKIFKHRNENYTNWIGHMTKMAAMPIF